jgi:hypothetical protein
MFAIIGILVVFDAVVGGYLMERGNLKVLVQPAELLIIGGRRDRDRAGSESSSHSQEHCPGESAESSVEIVFVLFTS